MDSLSKLRLDQLRYAPDAPARFGVFLAATKTPDTEVQEAGHDPAGDADVAA